MGECEHCGAREILRPDQVSWHCSYCNAFNRLDLPPQPASGYTKNVTPRGPVVRPEDAFPESCCEGGPMEERDE